MFAVTSSDPADHAAHAGGRSLFRDRSARAGQGSRRLQCGALDHDSANTGDRSTSGGQQVPPQAVTRRPARFPRTTSLLRPLAYGPFGPYAPVRSDQRHPGNAGKLPACPLRGPSGNLRSLPRASAGHRDHHRAAPAAHRPPRPHPIHAGARRPEQVVLASTLELPNSAPPHHHRPPPLSPGNGSNTAVRATAVGGAAGPHAGGWLTSPWSCDW